MCKFQDGPLFGIKPNYGVLIFVSGPFTKSTKHPDQNQNMLHAVAAGRWLMQRGYGVYVPHSAWLGSEHGLEYEWIIETCFSILSHCDGVFMLEGFEYSPGAQREYQKARDLKLPIEYEGK